LRSWPFRLRWPYLRSGPFWLGWPYLGRWLGWTNLRRRVHRRLIDRSDRFAVLHGWDRNRRSPFHR
jgi:hypothetical protein